LVAAAAALAASALTSWLVVRAGRERLVRGGRADAGSAGAPPAGGTVRDPRTGRAIRTGRTGEARVDAAKLGSFASVEFSPPAELTPAQGGVVLAEAAAQNQRVAWLIGAATDGYLDIEQIGREVTLVTLVRRPRQDQSSVSRTLDTAFDGRERLTLGTYDPSFAAAWREIGEELAAWKRTGGLWDPAGDLHRKLAWVLGAVVAVGGLAITALGGAAASRWSWVWLALVAWGGLLAGAGLAALVRGWELRVRTPWGCELWLRVESFRRFLAGPDAHHLEEAANGGVLGQYTAWAVAVGEIDRWSRLVAASARCAGDPVGTRYASIAPSLPSAALASTSVPRSSSTRTRYWGWSSGDSGWSGGDSGGGGSGGGDGGGGGGSW
jgi:uncharacterized membrane protein YgcG